MSMETSQNLNTVSRSSTRAGEKSAPCDACGSNGAVVTPAHRRYREPEMLDALRAAAAEVAGGPDGKPLTKTAYDAYQRDHGGPSGIWLIRHFGTWRAAVLAAGLPANARMGRRAQYSDGDLAASVASYLATPGATGSYAGYEEWAAGCGAPSGPTLRARFGTWNAARERAAVAARPPTAG